MRHKVTEVDKSRWCKGKTRAKLKKELVHKKASVKFRELAALANVDSTMRGNATPMFSLSVLQKIRMEVHFAVVSSLTRLYEKNDFFHLCVGFTAGRQAQRPFHGHFVYILESEGPNRR